MKDLTLFCARVQEKNGSTVTANLLTGLGIDEFFTRTDGAGARALLTDALGSTVALGDGTGSLVTQYTYEPFGVTSETGAPSTNSYKYTGREDDGSGLLYYRARYYHPRLQRFLSEDPIGFGGGDVNIYAYTRNRPVSFRDPLGLFTIGDYFDSDLTLQGLAAFADGTIPFWDPLAANGLYNPCDSRLAYNKTIGILTRDLELGLTIGVSSGALFGRGGLLNQGPWRAGWGQKRGVGQVFRIGGPGNDIHFLDWPPRAAAAIGYGGMVGASLADLFMNGGQPCGCQQ